MPQKSSRNGPCPCGSGKKYKKCCINKGFDWVDTEDGGIARSIPLTREMSEVFNDLRESQIRKYGRLQERVFEGAPSAEVLEHLTVEAMKKAQIDPALIYAYEETNGLMLNNHNEHLVPDVDIALWDAAIDKYERQTGTKASHRRLDDNDCEAMLRNAPQERSPRGFVTRLAFPPPFSQDEWGGQPLSSIINDPERFDYFKRCLNAVEKSGRGRIYFNLFCVMAHRSAYPDAESDFEANLEEAQDQHYSPDQFEDALESLFVNCQPENAIPSAAAAFEFLGYIDQFMRAYAKEAGCEDELSDALEKITGLTMFAFAAAVNAELGIQPDIWKKQDRK